jgi:ABC-2 type transport system ATP-binding protein
LEVSPGKIYGLLGPNGSGKTTLLRILAGLWDADSGRVARPGTTLAHIGYVAQRFCLYEELTVLENLRFQAAMLGASAAAITRVLEQFALAALTGRRAAALSGGERQRLMLAAALLLQPKFLLLDEPTTALDPPSRVTLWALLRAEAARGVAVVLTSHEPHDALRCDVVLTLRDGRLERRSP